MQYPFSCTSATYDAIETTLSGARLGRYLTAAKQDKQLALRLYVWNARLCEAFYFPLQTAEVSARNAIEIPVRKRFGNEWFNNKKFINLLPNRQKETLRTTIQKETKKRPFGLNKNDIIAGLPFGFWVSLMTKSYNNHLWINGIKQSFPNAATDETRQSIYQKLDQMRHFRNSVAHHFAIFDRGTQKEMLNTLHIINLVCKNTHWFSQETGRLNFIINTRPRV